MRLNVRLHLAAGLAALAALALVLDPVEAQTPTVPVVVRISPASVQVASGATADVAVEVVDVPELYGFDVTVTFDPKVVEVVDSDPNTSGIQVSQGLFLDPGFAVANTVDNVAGTVHFVMTQLNPSEAKSGTGNLIVIKLLGKAAGTNSALTLANAQLARRDGFMIPSAPRSGQVAVVSAGEPTGTPIPTQGAGTPMATSTPEATLPPATQTALAAMPTLAPSPAEPSQTPAVVGSPTSASASPEATPSAALQATVVPASEAASPVAPASVPAGVSALPSESTAPTEPAPEAALTTALAVQVSQGGGEPTSQTTGPRLARAALWVAIVAGALAVAAGTAVLVVWLRGRRPRPR